MGREADTLLQKAEVGGGDPALREYELRNTSEKYIGAKKVGRRHSLILGREGLILTLSILPCPQGWIS